jgi:hypothetical protein
MELDALKAGGVNCSRKAEIPLAEIKDWTVYKGKVQKLLPSCVASCFTSEANYIT